MNSFYGNAQQTSIESLLLNDVVSILVNYIFADERFFQATDLSYVWIQWFAMKRQ